MPAVKPDALSSIPMVYTAEGENQFLKVGFWPPHAYHGMLVQILVAWDIYTYAHAYTLNIF